MKINLTPLSRALICSALLLTSAVSFAANSSEEEMNRRMKALRWQMGPTEGNLQEVATIKVAKNDRFLDTINGSKFLEITGNLPSKENIYVSENWWASFDFSKEGYVKDDEKIDADDLLKTMQDNQKEANEERRKKGMSELFIDGWFIPPAYNKETKRLEWALKLHDSTSPEPVINYTVRLLGRKGYESATLVSSPETLTKDVKEFQTVLQGFDFKEGERYAEFKEGDRVAEYGLAALIAGGAAAVMAKTGLWKVLAKFIKVIAIGAVALVAGIGKFIVGRSKRKSAE